jgi:hypothetical protein
MTSPTIAAATIARTAIRTGGLGRFGRGSSDIGDSEMLV